MLKNISRLECKVNDKTYQLLCDMDSPIEHVKEALFQFQKYIGFVEDQIKQQQEEKKLSEDNKPEDKTSDEAVA